MLAPGLVHGQQYVSEVLPALCLNIFTSHLLPANIFCSVGMILHVSHFDMGSFLTRGLYQSGDCLNVAGLLFPIIPYT